MGDRIMMGLINHFNTLLEDENVRINGKEGAKLMIDPSFCRVWFGTSLNVMLVKKYGEEDYKEVFNYIKDNYLQKECKIRSVGKALLTDFSLCAIINKNLWRFYMIFYLKKLI